MHKHVHVYTVHVYMQAKYYTARVIQVHTNTVHMRCTRDTHYTLYVHVISVHVSTLTNRNTLTITVKGRKSGKLSYV